MGHCWTDNDRGKAKVLREKSFQVSHFSLQISQGQLRIEPETTRSEAGNLVLIYILQTSAVALRERLNMYRNTHKNFMELFINLLFAENNPHTIIFLPSIMSTS